jgi:hypothetical protein
LLAFALIGGAMVAPWAVYSRIHAPTPEQRAEQRANIVQPYTTQFWQKVAGQPLLGAIDAEQIPERIGNNLYEIGMYDFGGIAFYPFFRPLEPGQPIRIQNEGRMFSLLLAMLAIAGFGWIGQKRLTMAEFVTPLSIGVMLLWGWEQFRLLLPLIPFLLFYLLMGVQAIVFLVQKMKPDADLDPLPGAGWRMGGTPLLIAAVLFVIVNLYGNFQYIQKKNDPIPEYRLQWMRAYEQNVDLMTHIRNTVPREEPIATQNPALLHLFSGHKTVASDDPAGAWETWNRLGVRYLARTSPFPLPPPDAAENKYRTMYRASGNFNLRLVDLGDPSSRPAWGK